MATTAEVLELPVCDFGCGESAHFDAKTVHGPWAFMCVAHYNEHGHGSLGLGLGQRIYVNYAK
jgi:hypothetical protein